MTDLRRRGLLHRTGGRRWADWIVAEDLRIPARTENPSDVDTAGTRSTIAPAAPTLPLADTSPPVGHSETPSTAVDTSLTPRQQQLVAALSDGPLTSRELAEKFGVTRGAVLMLLRKLEARGLVRPTEEGRRSRRQRWVLTRSASAG